MPKALLRTCATQRFAGTPPRFRRPVARPNPTTMSLNNLARNRKSQARVLTEPVAWPVSIKPFENALKRVRGDPRTVVINSDDDVIEAILSVRLSPSNRSLERNPHYAARVGKRAGVIDEIGDDLRKSRIVSKNKVVGLRIFAAPNRDGQFDLGAAATRRIPRHRHDCAQKGGDVDRARFASRQLGIEARGVGDVADQPIEPSDIMLHDGNKLIA